MHEHEAVDEERPRGGSPELHRDQYTGHMANIDLKGSEERLWALIEERTRAGADTRAIDQRIWDLFGDEWAIMFTDLSGFSRQVEAFGIIHFLQIIFEKKRLLLPIVAAHDGVLIKVEADSFLIIFRRPDRALECAVAMQQGHIIYLIGSTFVGIAFQPFIFMLIALQIGVDTYMSRLNADPENHVLRRSIARAGGQLGRADFAVQQYRYLIKRNALLDHVVDERRRSLLVV